MQYIFSVWLTPGLLHLLEYLWIASRAAGERCKLWSCWKTTWSDGGRSFYTIYDKYVRLSDTGFSSEYDTDGTPLCQCDEEIRSVLINCGTDLTATLLYLFRSYMFCVILPKQCVCPCKFSQIK